ncbi:MAG: MAF protein [Cellvibrionaceae bacterium]|jgi:MAF protein
MSAEPTKTLILASSSPYRRELLQKLTLDFISLAPNIDETEKANETPDELVSRLALEKAEAIAKDNPNALIIGSDQVAVLGEEILTKPQTYKRAHKQLSMASGKRVKFLTSLCLYNSANNKYQLKVVTYFVDFLALSEEQIEHYLRKEQPYDCAGSFKSEGLGITLFASMSGDDPNTLIGLPLIALTSMLRNEGIEPLS